MQKETFEVEYEYEGERLDKYVSILFPEQSRSFFQKLIKDGNVSVNDKVQKANYRLKTEDLVTVEIPDAVETQILPEDIPLDILYEDDDLLVVNKPKGMVVHPSAGHYSGTLVNAVMYHCRDSLSGINGEIRPGIVHRIDMDTTGSLIVCKNDESHVFIAEQIKEHSVNRRYRGIVYGVVRDDEGTIHAPIGRHPVDRKKMAINEKNGKDAITHYKVLERFDKYTYMEFKLETGRTHQIRVHMASIGHPLLGDTLYSNGKSPYKLQGQTLHAMTIGFIHPRTREYMEISAPLPEFSSTSATALAATGSATGCTSGSFSFSCMITIVFIVVTLVYSLGLRCMNLLSAHNSRTMTASATATWSRMAPGRWSKKRSMWR